MSRICITVLVGLPAASKTTFCQKLLSLPQLPFNVTHVCFDDLFPFKFDHTDRAETTSEFSYKTERSKILALIQSIVSSLSLENIIQSPNDNYKIPTSFHNTTDYVILFDDNNYYTSMRYKIYQMCQRNQIYFAQIYFPIDLALSFERNSLRSICAQVPQSIIKQMEARFEVPNSAEYFWESDTFEFENGKDFTIQTADFLSFIANILQRPMPHSYIPNSSIEKQHTCSPVHNLDVLLRRRIKEILEKSKVNAAVKKDEAERLNKKRKEILRNYSKCPEKEMLSFFEKLY